MPDTRTRPDFVKARLKPLRARLRDAGCDALLVTNPADIRYLTGFVGDDSFALVPDRGKVTILSDFRFDEQIDREAPQAKKVIRDQSLFAEVEKQVNRRGIKKLGLQQAYMTLGHRQRLVKHIGAKRVKAIDDGLIEQRAVKTDDEVKVIRRALKIQQQAYLETLDFIKPGMTEREAAAYLEYRMMALGADGPSFHTIMAAEPNGSLPHAIPGPRKLANRKSLLIDWGARFNGYCSDLTRVVSFGSMPREVREIYRVVLDAQMAAIDAIKPGKKLSDIDAVARDWITDAGYGDRFGHSLGHGIGLDIHEQPTLSERSKGTLEPGHVVTVEPGIYLPGVGGVRIEDDVLVTERGHTVLSDLPIGLDSAII